MQSYLLKERDNSQIKSAAVAAAAERGLPIVWPKYDSKDKQTVLFADVWAGFSEPLLQASTRYARGAVLAGNLAWNGRAWEGQWSLIDESTNQRWTFKNANYATVIRQALNRIADDLGQRFAVLDSQATGESERLRVELKGVSTVQQFQYAEKLLTASPSVKYTTLNALHDDSVVFDLVLRTDRKDFLQRMKRTRELKPLQVSSLNVQQPTGVQDDAQQAAVGDAAALQAQMNRSNLADYRYQLTMPR